MRFMKPLLYFLLLLLVCGDINGQDTLLNAQKIITNAKIISGPFTGNYTSMVIRGGKIAGLFTDDSWKKTYRSNHILDMKGQVVLPGFIDAHCHFLGLGKALDEVNLYGTLSWRETVDRVAKFIQAHPEKEWIGGRGWDQNEWPDKAFPQAGLLDSLFPDKYIVLSRVDGHAVIANKKALDFAGVTADSRIEGGKLLLEKGELTGVLIDNATSLIESKIPRPSIAQKIKWLLAAEKVCLQNGLTQVADAGLPMEDIWLIDSLCTAGALQMRFYLMANPDPIALSLMKTGGIHHDRVVWKSIKIYSDGALGSRGALLKKPYCDDKGNYGLPLTNPMKLDSLLQQIYADGFQANTHCIGDSANAMVLRAYAKVLKNADHDRRWRIEHAQVVDPTDLPYFRNYGVIPSVQPTHATSDMNWAENRLCKIRMPGAYSYQSLLAHSAFLPLGTDFPVEYVSPFYTIRSARFRQDAGGLPKKGFNKKEALTSRQTFAGMSLWAAMGNFWEKETGTLETGKWADFIVLGADPYTASFPQLKELQVNKTFIAGEEVFSR